VRHCVAKKMVSCSSSGKAPNDRRWNNWSGVASGFDMCAMAIDLVLELDITFRCCQGKEWERASPMRADRRQLPCMNGIHGLGTLPRLGLGSHYHLHDDDDHGNHQQSGQAPCRTERIVVTVGLDPGWKRSIVHLSSQVQQFPTMAVML
jgi:hypothetical protein